MKLPLLKNKNRDLQWLCKWCLIIQSNQIVCMSSWWPPPWNQMLMTVCWPSMTFFVMTLWVWMFSSNQIAHRSKFLLMGLILFQLYAVLFLLFGYFSGQNRGCCFVGWGFWHNRKFSPLSLICQSNESFSVLFLFLLSTRECLRLKVSSGLSFNRCWQ